MSNINRLVPMLEGVFLGGIIEECILTVKDNEAHIRAMDMTQAVYVQGVCPFEHDDDKMGLGSLSLFIKYLRSYASSEMAFTRTDNVLTVKPESGGTLKYLLSDTDLVPTYDEAWDEDPTDPIDAMIDGQENKLELTETSVKEFLKLMGLFKPNSVTINVTKRGMVILHGGNETAHQFDVTLGKIKAPEAPISVKLYGNNITAVLSVVDFSEPTFNPVLYLIEGEVVILTESLAWVLRPLSGASDM